MLADGTPRDREDLLDALVTAAKNHRAEDDGRYGTRERQQTQPPGPLLRGWRCLRHRWRRRGWSAVRRARPQVEANLAFDPGGDLFRSEHELDARFALLLPNNTRAQAIELFQHEGELVPSRD